MAFDSRKQSIPQCFIDKMKIDRQIENIKKNPLINLAIAKKAKLMQNVYRQRCVVVISKNAGPIIDGGSAGGGSNTKFATVDAVAA